MREQICKQIVFTQRFIGRRKINFVKMVFLKKAWSMLYVCFSLAAFYRNTFIMP